jgi:hypothetical protein
MSVNTQVNGSARASGAKKEVGALESNIYVINIVRGKHV